MIGEKELGLPKVPFFIPPTMYRKGLFQWWFENHVREDLESLKPPPTSIISSLLFIMHGALDSEFRALRGKDLTWNLSYTKHRECQGYSINYAQQQGWQERSYKKNCAPRSFMNTIFHIETRKSGKQFVLHKSGKIGELRSVFLICYD